MHNQRLRRLQQSTLGWIVNLPEIRFPRIPSFSRFGASQAHLSQSDETADVPSPLLEVCYQCKDSYVLHWITCINREDSKTGQDAYETFSEASQDSLDISDASGHTNSWNQKMIQHREWRLDPRNVLQGEFLHPRECKK